MRRKNIFLLLTSVLLLSSCSNLDSLLEQFFPHSSSENSSSISITSSIISSVSSDENSSTSSLDNPSLSVSGSLNQTAIDNKMTITDKSINLYGDENNDNEQLEIYFFQLENASSQTQSADAFFIKLGDVEIIYDAGTQGIGSNVVIPYLKENNIIEDNVIELAINTHTDADHIGGFVGLSNGGKYDQGILGSSYSLAILLDSGYQHTTALYQNYLNLAANRINNGTTYYSYESCMTNENIPSKFYLGKDTYLTLLDSKLYQNNFEDVTGLNDSSIPALLTHGNNTFLLMGDCEKKAEERVLEYNNIGKVDFFKANHHGSETSNTNALLNVIKPDYIVIDSTKENKYDLPRKSIVDRFLKYCDKIYAPFINGGIHIYSNKETITFNCDGFIDYQNGGILLEETVGEPISLQNTSWYQNAEK